MSWLDPLGLKGADAATLAALPLQNLAAHTPLFRANDSATAFVLVVTGHIEVRRATLLLDMAHDGVVLATQADLAARIGSAREVISRKLESFARDGWISTERGQVTVLNPTALRQLATAPV